MNEVQEWLLDWFRQQHGGKLPGELDDNDDAMFIGSGVAGWLDSFGMIELIAAAEDRFDVEFSEEQFQDRQFGTVRGFSEMLDALRKSNSRT